MSEFQSMQELMDYVNKEAERRVQEILKQRQSKGATPKLKFGAPAGI